MEINAELKSQLELEFERAKTKVSNLDGYQGCMGAQQAYNMAYQKLVRAGIRLQIKKKYRRI